MLLGRRHARFLVDAYYIEQERRKALFNQCLACEKEGEAHTHLKKLAESTEQNEIYIRNTLKNFAKNHPVGQWSMSIVGIAEVLSAGLLAYIDITKAPTVGALWRYLGLDPTLEWLGRKRSEELVGEIVPKGGRVNDEHLAMVAGRTNRKLAKLVPLLENKEGKITRKSLQDGLAKCPWNQGAKVLAWKIGESFKKVSGHPRTFYGRVYNQRKLYEIEKNEKGDYADQAAMWLKKVPETSVVSIEAYEKGKLPVHQIYKRSARYAAKLFLAHWHHVMHVHHFGTAPPKPYPFAFNEGGRHTHYCGPPNFQTERDEATGRLIGRVVKADDDPEIPCPDMPE
jgi:hypothetical protein